MRVGFFAEPMIRWTDDPIVATGRLNVGRKEPFGPAHQVSLARMRVELDSDLARGRSGIGEILGPPFDPKAEEVFRHRRLLAPLEVRDRPKPVDVAAIENEHVSVLLPAIVRRSIHHDGGNITRNRRIFSRWESSMSRRLALLTAFLVASWAAAQSAAPQRIRNHFDSDAHLSPPAF